MAQHFTQVIATSFRIGIQLSAPFLVFGLLFNLGLGVLSRLMPQMQVFFIGLPLSILLGLMLLLIVIGTMMGTFTDYLDRRSRPALRHGPDRERTWPTNPTTSDKTEEPTQKKLDDALQKRRRRQEPGSQHLVRPRRRHAGADDVRQHA